MCKNGDEGKTKENEVLKVKLKRTNAFIFFPFKMYLKENNIFSVLYFFSHF